MDDEAEMEGFEVGPLGRFLLALAVVIPFAIACGVVLALLS